MEQINGLLVMDVDSTLIMEEGIDLLGEEGWCRSSGCGCAERAMQEFDFEAALRERVHCQGYQDILLQNCRIRFTPGAEDLRSRAANVVIKWCQVVS